MATLSSNMVNVGVSMRLEDHFSTEAGRVTDAYRRMITDMSDMNRGISMSMGTALDKGIDMIKGMWTAVEKYASVSDTIFLVTKMTGTTMAEGNKLMELVQDINKQTPVTAEQIASGAKYLAMAGNSMENIKAMLPPISKLSSILGHEIGGKGGTADLLTNIMIGMDIPMSRVKEIADQIGVAVTSSNMSLTDFAQTMQYASATVRTLKIPFEEVATTVGMLGNMGIQGSRAGTELKNAYENIVKTIGGQKRGGQQALASIGLSIDDFKDANGNMITLAETAAKIGEAFKKMGVTSMTEGILKSGFFYNVFGMRGKSAVTDLVDKYLKNSDDYYQLLNKIRNSQGFVDKTTEERMKTLAGIIDQFKATWENFVITYGKQLNNLFSGILKVGTKVLDFFTWMIEDGFGSWFVRISSIAVILKTIWSGFKIGRVLIKTLLSPTVAVSTNLGKSSSMVRALNTGLAATNTQLATTNIQLSRMVALLRQATLYQSVSNGIYTGNQLRYLASMGIAKNSAGRFYWVSGKHAGKFASKSQIQGLLRNQGYVPMGIPERGAAVPNVPSVPKPKSTGVVTRIGGGLMGKGIWGTLASIALQLGLAAVIDGLINKLMGNSDSLDDNTDALNANTNNITNYNEYLMAREKKFVEYFTNALQGNTPKDTKITIYDSYGRQLGTGNLGDDIGIEGGIPVF